jgi:hypothetical protein
MICPKHGINEMECDCPHWSQEAVREFKARQQPALIPKRLQKQYMALGPGNLELLQEAKAELKTKRTSKAAH